MHVQMTMAMPMTAAPPTAIPTTMASVLESIEDEDAAVMQHRLLFIYTVVNFFDIIPNRAMKKNTACQHVLVAK